jgi:archaellum biogenesis ATPase FlaH
MKVDELERIKSGMSQAYWCDTSEHIAKFQPAKIAFDTPDKQDLAWFDTLFEGGLMLPKAFEDEPHPLTMLVAGPPGSGKTTLITELCYRLAVNEQKNPTPLSTLYISTDADTDRMIQNAVDLGWDEAADYFIPFDPENKIPKLKRGLKSMVGVWGREKFMKSIEKQDLLSAIVVAALTSLDQWLVKAKPADLMSKLKRTMINQPIEDASGGSVEIYGEKYIPDILVLDSLNILNPEEHSKFFQSFVNACKATKLVIFILNTGPDGQDHKPWEYYSDIVLRLGYEYTHDYYVRTIEIIKARFQSQRWGKHQLKIYAKPNYANPKNFPKPVETDDKAIQEYNILTVRREAFLFSPPFILIYPYISGKHPPSLLQEMLPTRRS